MKEFFDMYEYKNNYEVYDNIKSIKKSGVDQKDVTFSIITPTYKRSKDLKYSLMCSLQQEDFDKYEIIIVDNDPSMDDGRTLEVVKSFNSEKIHYFVNEENIGLCGNWNRCVELSRGKYIVMIHDDDCLSPYFLKTIYNFIKNRNYEGFIGVDYIKFNSNELPVFSKPSKISYTKINKKDFFYGRSINIAGMTFSKNLAIKMGGFRDEYLPNEDSIFIYQGLVNSGKIINVNKELAGYRVEHNLSMSGNTIYNIIYMMQDMRNCIAKHEPFADIFMKLFGTEYLENYIEGAMNYWNIKLNKDEIISTANIIRKSSSIFRTKILKVFLLVRSIFFNKFKHKFYIEN